MKTYKGILIVGFLGVVLNAGAQTSYDAVRIGSGELNGTARFVGMGGAMGALGGDISVMGTNPAGIGIYRSNDVAVSFGFNSNKTKSDFGSVSMKEDRTRASFDQIGFVYSNKIGNNTSLRFVNFGFNYHKHKNFNELFSMGGLLGGYSQTWQMASMTDGLSIQDFDKVLSGEGNPYIDMPDVGYLTILGGRAMLVDPEDEEQKLYQGWPGDQNLYTSRQEGGINQYDFNIAFNVEDRFYFGATLGVYDVNYNRYSSYTEDLLQQGEDGQYYSNGGYTLENWFRTEGTGVDLKLGVIVRPFENSPFRLGFAVHTPTWYDLTDSYSAAIHSEIDHYNASYSEYTADALNGDRIDNYCLTTPWKFNVSAGTTVGSVFALGAEYEYQDYSSSNVKTPDGIEMTTFTDRYKANLKGVHVLRLGMEARLAPQFSLRAGYNFTSSIFNKDAFKFLPYDSPRTDTEYNNINERNTVTCGLGYRGSIIYADLAYKYDMYKSDFYAFVNDGLPATKVDNSRHQLLLTVGARF